MEQDQIESLVHCLEKINSSIKDLTGSVESLGLNHADTKMGAIEVLANEVKNLASVILDK